MAKHQKRFLDIFLDNSSGLSNAVEVVISLLSMAFSDGFLRLKEVSTPDDLARSPFTCSLFTCSLKAQTFQSFCWNCQSPLCWGRIDGQICCNLLAIAPPNPVSGVVGHAIDSCITLVSFLAGLFY